MVYADLIRAVSLYHADSSVLDKDLIRFINIYRLVCIKSISSIWIPIDTYNDLCMIRLSGQNLKSKDHKGKSCDPDCTAIVSINVKQDCCKGEISNSCTII